jgi:hypothetical protein
MAGADPGSSAFQDQLTGSFHSQVFLRLLLGKLDSLAPSVSLKKISREKSGLLTVSQE